MFTFFLLDCIAGQTQRSVKIQEALGVLAFANRMPIALSPDGQWVAYTVEDHRKHESTKDERYMCYTPTGAFTEALGCDIWITNTKTFSSGIRSREPVILPAQGHTEDAGGDSGGGAQAGPPAHEG